jgi:hypothetical protein
MRVRSAGMRVFSCIRKAGLAPFLQAVLQAAEYHNPGDSGTRAVPCRSPLRHENRDQEG